jgi:exopolyphosphatase / guanosine-5'-triphosphate,3'-diphosphate pyrophosphatase
MDLGGGSLEVALGDSRHVRLATSVALGTARMHGELGASDPLTPGQQAAASALTVAGLAPVRTALSGYPGVAARTIVSGGTARALARLATGKARRWASDGPGEVNQVELPAQQVRELARLLGELNLEQRLALPGMQARRAPILPVGAVILATAATELGVERYVVSEWGLREGAMIDALNSL